MPVEGILFQLTIILITGIVLKILIKDIKISLRVFFAVFVKEANLTFLIHLISPGFLHL